MKLGHIGLPVKNLDVSAKFYDALAPAVGFVRIDESDDLVGYGEKGQYQFYLHT